MGEVTRRQLLAAGAAATGALGLAACTTDGGRPDGGAAGGSVTTRPTTSTTIPTTTAAPDPAQWLIDENALPGTPGWQVPDAAPEVWDRIRGYATATSVNRGGTVDLRVSTPAADWRVEAYRTGWYGGAGARLVWQSPTLPGLVQPPPVLDPAVGTWTAPWETNVQVTADSSWPPGMYLLKLVSSDGGQTYVPLVVRDDASRAALLVQSSVTTWQAYNEWGGSSLYADARAGKSGRADVVTFDRPYYRKGSGEFFGREFELVQFVERLGLDVTYWTDIDLHATPEQAANHRAVVSLGHDEYYSTRMRRGLEAARDAGVNLLFLGANACFRKIRLEDSDTGPFRREVNYRSAEADPVTAIDPSESTVSWRSPPSNEPESSLIGNLYESNPVDGDMWFVNTENWMFEGSGLRNGDVIPGLVGNEYDRVTPEQPTPEDIEVLCHSPVVVRGSNTFADVTWYTTDSGAGVFAVGTFEWIKRLAPDTAGRAPSAADPEAALAGGDAQRADGGVRRAGGTGTPRCPQPGAVRHRPRLRGGSTPDLNATPTRFCVASTRPRGRGSQHRTPGVSGGRRGRTGPGPSGRGW